MLSLNLDLPTPTLIASIKCNSNLNFNPRSHWPQGMIGIAINNELIAGFDKNLALNYEINSPTAELISALYKSIYSELSFIELIKLWSLGKKISWLNFEKLAQAYSIKFNEQFIELAEEILKLEVPFQNWCANKKIQSGDLLSLLSIKQMTMQERKAFVDIQANIVNRNLSKSQGVAALELSIELILMGSNMEEISKNIHDNESWIQAIKKNRYPNSTSKDQKSEAEIQKLPWPITSQVRWTRHGDKSGIEVKLFFANSNDLKKCTQSFERIQEILNQDPDRLWKE